MRVFYIPEHPEARRTVIDLLDAGYSTQVIHERTGRAIGTIRNIRVRLREIRYT